ncbi:MAG TPA: lactonase family protein [Chloroflexota bacterium]|nr:lactonase family protein [Chloroflexota bacterium]
MAGQTSAPSFLYVGTFTQHAPHGRGRAEGIYVFRLDPASGALTHVQTMPEVANPSFLTLAPDQRHLYAVNAVPEIDGHPGGAVSAFSVDPATGGLTLLNRQAAHGAGPCHVCVDATGRYVLVASYHGGSVAVLPIQGDGRLGPATDAVYYSGAGVDPVHQDRPHAHSINLDPANRVALVCNQGLDKVFIYRFDPARGTLTSNADQPWAETRRGSGPRHLAFHPGGHFVYVIDEQGSSLTAFAYDAAAGTLREVQTVSTLPDGFSGPNACADVHVHPSGRYVYGSNRGHDSLAIFAVDEETGRLSSLGHQSTRGRTPRNFTLDPTGTLLLAANQDSDSIVAFRVDRETGQLTSLGTVADVPTPTCLVERQGGE